MDSGAPACFGIGRLSIGTILAFAYSRLERLNETNCAIHVHTRSADAFEINWMTNTTSHNFGLMEGNSYTIQARTDENYSRVDWYVDGEYEWTENADGEEKTWSSFERTYSTGTPEGRQYVIEARAYNIGETETASKSRRLTVYALSQTVNIEWLYVGTKNIVRKQGKWMDILTDKAFLKVEWRVNGVLQPLYTDYGPSRRSRFWYNFDEGSEEGTEYEIEARAYATGSSSFDTETKTVTFWADLGLMWRSVTARVNGVTALGGSAFRLSTSHTVGFYNDNRTDQYRQVKGQASWWRKEWNPNLGLAAGDDPNNWDLIQDAHTVETPSLRFWPVFSGSTSFSLTQDCTLKDDRFHAVEAYTSISGLRFDNETRNGTVIYPKSRSGPLWPHHGAPTTVGEASNYPEGDAKKALPNEGE